MTETKRPLKVFLCHASADKAAVRDLYARLTKDGVDAWLDKERLLPGQDWELEIRKAVRETDVVVVCLSKQFNQAGFRQKEVRLALDTAMEKPEGEIFIIPARLEECDTPENLKRWHRVELSENDGYEKFMRALRTRADNIGVTLRIKRSRGSKGNKKKDPQEKASVLEREELKPQPPINAKDSSAEDILNNSGNITRDVVVTGSNNVVNISNQGSISAGNSIGEKPKPEKTKQSRKTKTIIIAALIPAIATIVAAIIGLFPQVIGLFPQVIEFVSGPPNIATFQALDNSFLNSSSEITDARGVKMKLVSEGGFIMGNDNRNDDEKPEYRVYLDHFYIDKYEVTNSLYKSCVDTGPCQPPKQYNSSTRSNYFGNSRYDNFPVIYVDWFQARAYCEWRGARLPTEAEWEKAARGTDERLYPWGEGLGCANANYDNCVGDITEVGAYEDGKSIYGVYDLAGNVWEWVGSAYEKYPYVPSDGREVYNNQSQWVQRGGSWGFGASEIETTFRGWNYVSNATDRTGFRCAKDATP